MNNKTLLGALLKLRDKDTVPASQFSVVQRNALDRFARQTGAVSCQRQGRGDIYQVTNPVIFNAHLVALSPCTEIAIEPDTSKRAQHIAYARDSKAGYHRHDHHYLLLKAVGDNIRWWEARRAIELPLSQNTRDFGAGSLLIKASDSWTTNHALWLVENQALFDRTDWLPACTSATLIYYGGQINNILLNWLTCHPRASQIIHFPDYDGVGLANFVRLYSRLGNACKFWLMPDWSSKLTQYGSTQLWQNTLRDFTHASLHLPTYLAPLIQQMCQSGSALEQEAIWLPG